MYMPKDSLEYKTWRKKVMAKHPSKNPVIKEEWAAKISEAKKGRPSTFKGKKFPEESKKILREKAKKRWENPSYRSRIIKGLIENPALHKPKSAETRKKISESEKGIKRPYASVKTKEMWKDPEFVARWWVNYQKALDEGRIGTWKGIRASRNRPNKIEKKMSAILDAHFAGEWIYTGDASVIIAGLNPDFVHENGVKKIIEVFGDYWHTEGVKSWKQTEEGRRQLFGECGYDLLVIWQHDLKNLSEENIVEKVQKFMATPFLNHPSNTVKSLSVAP